MECINTAAVKNLAKLSAAFNAISRFIRNREDIP